MFNLSTQEVVLSIENTPLVNLDGILYQEYDNFFGNNILSQLKNLDNLNFMKLENQNEQPRRRVDYNEQLMKNLKIFFMQSTITNALVKKFNVDLKFDSVDIWQDTAGYYLPPHTDDARIKLALQIYLGSDGVGTSLYDSKKNVLKTFNFKPNKGYALLNTDVSLHGTSGRHVSGTRESVYVRYR